MIVHPSRTEVSCKTEIPFFSALWETRGNLKGFLSSDLSPSRKRRELLSRLPLAGYLKCENHPVLFPLRVFHFQNRATHHASHITFTFTKGVANRIQTGCCQKINYNINIFFYFSLFIFIYLLINLFVYVFICFLLRLESQPAVITGSRNGWNIFLKYPSRRKLLYHSIANLNQT